ncbi:MAG: sugar ABC transporter permease [Thaumarchaeota archaeon]|nr:MAG: sugar ABC transporter permease [Nitrososphaerota archaeon]
MSKKFSNLLRGYVIRPKASISMSGLGGFKSFLKEKSRTFFVIAFLTPFLAALTIMYGLPCALSVLMSFTDMGLSFELHFLNPLLKNYYTIFHVADPRVPVVAQTTILYVGCTLLINAGFSLVLGVLTAYCIRNENVASVLRLLWFLPRMTPVIIYALLWLWFTDPTYGPLSIVSSWIGLKGVRWLLDKPYSQLLMILVNGYIGASWGMVIYVSSIKTIPLEIIYAAKADGATDWDVIRRIILPLLKWPILFVTSWQTLSLIGSYVEILAIWDGYSFTSGVEVWSLFTYHTAFEGYRFGYSAALAIIMATIALILVAIYFKVFGFKRMLEPSRIEV